MTELKKCVTGFIEDIWNHDRFDMLSEYLHPEFIDHSLPRGMQNADRLKSYLTQLRIDVSHTTEIENIVYAKDFAILKVKVILSPSSTDCSGQHNQEILEGYRILAIAEQRIIAHWEFF